MSLSPERSSLVGTGAHGAHGTACRGLFLEPPLPVAQRRNSPVGSPEWSEAQGTRSSLWGGRNGMETCRKGYDEERGG